MQIRTEGPTREEGYSIQSEPKTSVSEKTGAPAVSFMDLMKSIQLRSQMVLEEGQKVSEPAFETVSKEEVAEERELFEEEEISSDEPEDKEIDTENSKLVRLFESKSKEEVSEDGEEDLELELEEVELDSPFISQMSAFITNLESKQEKEIEIHPANKEETSLFKKISKQSKEESHVQQAAAEKEETQASSIKTGKEEEKRPNKEIKRSSEKESLEEGLKSLEEARKFSKPANEEKILTVLKESHKENFIPESENWKITREKKQESLSAITKNQAKIASAEEASAKSDSSGKGSQNQEFSQRQGNETTLTLLKAGLGVQENKEVSASSSSKLKTDQNIMDRSQMRENFQRLVQSAKLNIVENGRSEATLRLNPKELGRVSLRISVEEDKVQGKIVVESDQVRKLFAGDLEQLRKDFKEQGLQLESLIVEVEDSFQFSFGEGGSSARDFEDAFADGSSAISSSSLSEEVSELGSTEISEFADKNTDRRLNILV
ncbi:flagellar hook-length control protein FliK [Leptospira langatensis]|uniref:Flagellar hook-length control protein FliK n=1 Tax=Leptospira langatensis TaxID=2484983 RepID=A0A5F1ZVX5_9LEPT|nr:flagellar hook-length control protein FliK [Leptospira langatensis]TGK00121.1 flagellar hook-length control protein FliK [Leptospira langatensis]TGL42755.1 flagellar hook-length control protein FliK [Leptospira langatensis]